MLHPQAKLLNVLPLLGLLPVVQKDIGFGWIGGSLDADPVGTPVLHLLVGARLDTSDELLDSFERPPVAQELVDERGEPPVIIHRLPRPSLATATAFRHPDLVFLGGDALLPRSTPPEEPRSISVHTVDRPPDLRIGVGGSTHHAGERHHAVRPPRLRWDRGRRPRTEPRRGWRTENWQSLLLVPGLLRRRWYRLGQTVRRRLEQFLQLLGPLLLLLGLPRLLATVLLQQLLELGIC